METRFPYELDVELDDRTVAGMDRYNNDENEKNVYNDNIGFQPIKEIEDMLDQIHSDLDVAFKDFSDEDFYLALDIMKHFFISCKWNNYFPEKVKTPMPTMIKKLHDAFKEIGSTTMKNKFKNDAGFLTFGEPDEFENKTSEEVFLKKLTLLDAQKKGQINAPTNLV